MKVTIGEMIDRISIVNIKLFFKENETRDNNDNDKVVAEAKRSINDLNMQRNALIEEMNLEFNELAKGKQQKLFGSNKMYGK